MSACAGCRHSAVPQRTADSASLLQIRQGYRARWNDLVCVVEADSGQWTLRVMDAAAHTLYHARRAGRNAAQAAAAEFAIFRALGPSTRLSPERLAHEWKWQQYW